MHRKREEEEEGKKENRHVSLAYASNPGPPGSLRFDIIISISMARRFVTLVPPRSLIDLENISIWEKSVWKSSSIYFIPTTR